MGFWKKIFGKKEQTGVVDDDWEQIVFERDDVNFEDGEQRRVYIANCLEQISEANREQELLSREYALVTSYLTDIEEIEALPNDEREEVDSIARRLLALEAERERYHDKKQRMDDRDYYRMRKLEDHIVEGIEKIKKEEKYGALVREDMQRLDRERHAFAYRREELENILVNMRGMVLIFISALVICLLMLAVLQFGFEMDTSVGYFLSIVAGAISITVLCLKYMDASRELLQVEKANNKLIQLHNKVKIRYVNNVNLLDYLYMKYQTNSGAALEKNWRMYLQEKEERKQYAEAEAKAEYYNKQLTEKLCCFRVKDPSRWAYQAKALLDKREMVEIRHDLIVRRQALRKQIDYNKEVAANAQEEIMEVANEYPAYTKEILGMVSNFEKS